MMDNIQKTFDLFHLCKSDQKEAVILSLDVEIAFDNLEHSYFLCLLKFMNFGGNFLQAVWSLCSYPKAAVKTNGIISIKFHLTRVTRGVPSVSTAV